MQNYFRAHARDQSGLEADGHVSPSPKFAMPSDARRKRSIFSFNMFSQSHSNGQLNNARRVLAISVTLAAQ
jgi:hypothetical protein